MRSATSWCRISKLNGKSGFKWPSLDELHRCCFKSGFDGAHDALNDVRATSRCFFKLISENVIERPSQRHGKSSRPSPRPNPKTNPKPEGSRASESTRVWTNASSPQKPTNWQQSQHKPVANLSSRTYALREFNSTLTVEGICGGCKKTFSVTLTRYEDKGRCPNCTSLVPFKVTWI